MARKLVNFCLAWAVVLGSWGGVLAAAACPHVSCETAGGAPGGAPGGASAHEGHSTAADGNSVTQQEHHQGHAGIQHEGHAAGQSAGKQPPPRESAEHLGGITPSSHDSSCTHCVGRADSPPSSNFEWQSGPSKKAGKETAAHDARQVVDRAAHFVPEITPAQHAPPGRRDRHLLILNVFRI